MASSEYATFGEARARLDEIVTEVRKKDLSLEKSLDLFEEAIKLGNRCAELVDTPDYTAEEELAAREVLGEGSDQAQEEDGSAEAAEGSQQAEGDSEGADAE